METRLKKLERMNKILSTGLLLALAPWVVAAGEAVPKLIEGTGGKFQAVQSASFDLVDDAGNKAGGLVGKKDASCLTIKDSNGKVRILIGFNNGHPSLLFADKDGRTVASYREIDGSYETQE